MARAENATQAGVYPMHAPHECALGLAEETADAVQRGAAEEDFERDAHGPDHATGSHDRNVLEQDPERDQHDAERRQRVETGEWRGEECGERAGGGKRSEDRVARPVVEEERRSRPGEALEAADHAQQPTDEALLARAGELGGAPALRQPDLLAPGNEL